MTTAITEHCPTCGGVVRVVGSDEGTQHYEPVEVAPASPLTKWLIDKIEAYHPKREERHIYGNWFCFSRKLDELAERWAKQRMYYALVELRALMQETPGE